MKVIADHASNAASLQNFNNLSGSGQQAILNFLRSLPMSPAAPAGFLRNPDSDGGDSFYRCALADCLTKSPTVPAPTGLISIFVPAGSARDDL